VGLPSRLNNFVVESLVETPANAIGCVADCFAQTFAFAFVLIGEIVANSPPGPGIDLIVFILCGNLLHHVSRAFFWFMSSGLNDLVRILSGLKPLNFLGRIVLISGVSIELSLPYDPITIPALPRSSSSLCRCASVVTIS
jgi:hypothetical protein